MGPDDSLIRNVIRSVLETANGLRQRASIALRCLRPLAAMAAWIGKRGVARLAS